MRVKLLWRPPARAWVSWGRAAVVSVGAKGLQASRQYSLGVGPMLLWLIVPMSARERQRQMDLAQPNLRRVPSVWTHNPPVAGAQGSPIKQ
jgi:hypothetical protein